MFQGPSLPLCTSPALLHTKCLCEGGQLVSNTDSLLAVCTEGFAFHFQLYIPRYEFFRGIH